GEAVAAAVAQIEPRTHRLLALVVADPAPQAAHMRSRVVGVAEIGREQQRPRDVLRMLRDIRERAHASHGDTDEPDFAIARARDQSTARAYTRAAGERA